MKSLKKWLALVFLLIVAISFVHLQAGDMPDQLEAHFLDVGQGDSIFIHFPDGQTMLIDAGASSAGGRVVSYLQQRGVGKIDFLVATHPHADHIGGMVEVVEAFNIGKVYMPKVDHTSKTYENLLLAIQEKGLKITAARAGLNIVWEEGIEGVKASFVAPCSSHYDNLNNYSAVVRVQYGKTFLLLTGDAETEAEQEMLAGGSDLEADLLKVGHHGSSTSTTGLFLDAVTPVYAVISCGEGNPYGHPHQETLDKLDQTGVETFRTDLHGTVVFVSDGSAFTPGEARSNQKTVVSILNEIKEVILSE